MDSDEEAAWLEEQEAIEKEEAAQAALAEEEEAVRKRACDSPSDIALKLVQNRQHLTFLLVYRLITLALTLLVATTSVERVFSAMNIIKSDLRNKIGDDWLNNLMICYVEKDIFAKIEDKKIMLRFHSYKERPGHLPQHFRLPGINPT